MESNTPTDPVTPERPAGTTTKAEWRAKLRCRRREISVLARWEAGEALARAIREEFTRPSAVIERANGNNTAIFGDWVVAAYYELPGEPPIAMLIDELRHKFGIQRVLIPKPGPCNRAIDWGFDAGQTSQRTSTPSSRLTQPCGPSLGPEALADARLILVPALGVDLSGTRLGQGGGWYDRALRWAPKAAVKLAVVYGNEVFSAGVLPRQNHDIPMDGALSPRGLLWFGTTAHASSGA